MSQDTTRREPRYESPSEALDFKSGRAVLYVPTHANGDIAHPDVERGVVVRANESTVFVLFHGDTNPKGCYPWNLVYERNAT